MEKFLIKKSERRAGKRNTSYIDLQIGIKRELILLAGDTVNFFIGEDFDLGINATLGGNINLLINQTVLLHPGDKIKIRLELSSAIAEIGIIRKVE